LLVLVQRKSKELAHTSGEQVETVSNLGNKGISGSKGSGAMTLQASATNSTSVVYMDEFDPTVARLNIVGSIDIYIFVVELWIAIDFSLQS
jgi:CCR4-NOT transcription complex subunit 10